MPEGNFTVYDVTKHVGPRRMLDVMDCSTQLASQMPMKEWEEYYFQEEKKRILNVISLEFSSTKLDSMVEAPKVVRQIDWVDNVWPRYLKEYQTEVRLNGLLNKFTAQAYYIYIYMNKDLLALHNISYLTFRAQTTYGK